MTRRLPFVLNRSSWSNRRRTVAGAVRGGDRAGPRRDRLLPCRTGRQRQRVARASRRPGRTCSATRPTRRRSSRAARSTVALSADPDKLDPTLSRSLYSRYVFHTMCEKLYDLGPDAKIVPQLATALPTISGDG